MGCILSTLFDILSAISINFAELFIWLAQWLGGAT
jgi:hypothetical protein